MIMHPAQAQIQQTRRDFLATSASGLGGAALASLLVEDGLLAKELADPLAPRKPHFEPTAKACINIFMAGAPSHLDLFDFVSLGFFIRGPWTRRGRRWNGSAA